MSAVGLLHTATASRPGGGVDLQGACLAVGCEWESGRHHAPDGDARAAARTAIRVQHDLHLGSAHQPSHPSASRVTRTRRGMPRSGGAVIQAACLAVGCEWRSSPRHGWDRDSGARAAMLCRVEHAQHVLSAHPVDWPGHVAPTAPAAPRYWLWIRTHGHLSIAGVWRVAGDDLRTARRAARAVLDRLSSDRATVAIVSDDMRLQCNRKLADFREACRGARNLGAPLPRDMDVHRPWEPEYYADGRVLTFAYAPGTWRIAVTDHRASQ